MVFVADVIPPELQRIIEFLDEHMAAIDVLGVEVRQYVGPGRRTLVPRIIGLTGAAQQAKAAGQRPRYPELLADAPDAVRNLEKEKTLLSVLCPAERPSCRVSRIGITSGIIRTGEDAASGIPRR